MMVDLRTMRSFARMPGCEMGGGMRTTVLILLSCCCLSTRYNIKLGLQKIATMSCSWWNQPKGAMDSLPRGADPERPDFQAPLATRRCGISTGGCAPLHEFTKLRAGIKRGLQEVTASIRLTQHPSGGVLCAGYERGVSIHRALPQDLRVRHFATVEQTTT